MFKKRNKKVIIVIHGLGNKPPVWLLKYWWKKSIREGLRKINKPKWFFKFKMVYWADILHPEPLSVLPFNKESPLYNDEPYTESRNPVNKKRLSNFKIRLLNKFEEVTDKLSFKKNKLFNLDIIFEAVIKLLFKDLDAYYSSKMENGKKIKDEICDRLAEIINKYKDYEIMLIAHSMGSIVAYDTLIFCTPDAEINTFVTIGSPLGMQYVMKKILSEQNRKYNENILLNTPENISDFWFNFSDPDDKVALIYRLGNNYKQNSGGIAPVDILVNNDYEFRNKRNPHKSYGYLRTPELAKIINEFLSL